MNRFKLKHAISLTLILVLMLSLLPLKSAAGYIMPTAEITMEEVVGATGSGGKQIYKLVGRVNAYSMSIIETWLSYDNTQIVPVHNSNYADVTITETSSGGTPLPFKRDFLKNTYEESYSSMIGWYILNDKTVVYLTLDTDLQLASSHNGTYMEFYFRLADGVELRDLNEKTFAIENQDTTPHLAKAWSIQIAGMDAPAIWYNKDVDGTPSNGWEPTLTYHNSVPYQEGTQPYSGIIDLSDESTSNIAHDEEMYRDYGIYWDKIAKKLTLSGVTGTAVLTLPADSTVSLKGTGNSISALNAENLTIEPYDGIGGSIALTNLNAAGAFNCEANIDFILTSNGTLNGKNYAIGTYVHVGHDTFMSASEVGVIFHFYDSDETFLAVKTFRVGEAVTAPSVSKGNANWTRYEFKHWMQDGEEFDLNAAVKAEDYKTIISLYAVYTETKYVSVTFEADDNTTIMGGDITYYAKSENPGKLYTDETLTAEATAPAVSANTGYRVKLSGGVPLWSDGNNEYTYSAIEAMNFTKNTTFTAQSIQTHTVTFMAGENGELEGESFSMVVDNGHALTMDEIPTPVANSGYVFDGWSGGDINAAIIADVTFTANFELGTYDVEFTTAEGITYEEISGVTDSKVKHLTDVTFKINVKEGEVVLNSVSYKVGDNGTFIELIKNTDGVYIISGSAIIDKVTINLDITGLHSVTFANGSNGIVSGGNILIKEDVQITEADMKDVTVTPAPGYKHIGWTLSGITTNPIGYTVNSAVTFTAIYDHETYDVTGDVTDEATHGTDYTFTPTVEGEIVIRVNYTVDGGESIIAAANTDGSYTIPGSSITGDIIIEFDRIEGTISFISKSEYVVLEDDTKIVLLMTPYLEGEKYTFDGKDLYWADRYEAYVCIAEADATEIQIAAGLSKADGAAEKIRYETKTTVEDANIINDMLHHRYTGATDKQIFEADVNGDKKVTTDDILWILPEVEDDGDGDDDNGGDEDGDEDEGDADSEPTETEE